MAASAERGLGEVVFRAKTARLPGFCLAAFGAGFLAIGWSFMGGDPNKGEGDPVVGIASLVLGAVPFALGLWYLSRRFTCHERGVASASIFGRSALLFSDMDRVRYRAIHEYVNGSFTGTVISMRLAGPRSSVSYSSNTSGAETENLEKLRDKASLVVSGRLYERLMDGGQIEWSPKVTLARDGLRFNTRGQESFVPFSPNVLFAFETGTLHLWLERERQSLLKISCDEVNFWPGLALFRRLQEECPR